MFISKLSWYYFFRCNAQAHERNGYQRFLPAYIVEFVSLRLYAPVTMLIS
jgi:hypothetical protein